VLMSRKNILMISNMYPSKKQFTFGIFVKNLCEVFLESGVDVNLAVIAGRGSSIIGKLLKYARFYITQSRKILFCKYDLIYINYVLHSAPPVAILGGFIRVPIVINFHGDDLLHGSRATSLLLRLSDKVVGLASTIVVPSRYFARLVSQRYPGCDDRIFVYPSGGVDTAQIKRSSESEIIKLKSELGLEGKTILGYVSRIDGGKGWDDLLRALALMGADAQNVHCLFIGDASVMSDRTSKRNYSEIFSSLVGELGLGKMVTYLGKIPQEELSKYYSLMDYFVFPTRLRESLGLVGLEAMACGVPVIGSRIGGLEDYVKTGINGYSFAPGKPEELRIAIMEALSQEDKAKRRMSEECYKTVDAYERSKVGEMLISQILSSISSRD